MSPFFQTFAHWLADYYLLSTVLLAFALVALAAIKQPAQRRAVAQSTLIALLLLAALCAIPGWSTVSLLTSRQPAANFDVPAETRTQVESDRAARDAHEQLIDVSRITAIHPPSLSSEEPAPAGIRHELSWSSLALLWAIGAAVVAAWLAMGSLAARRLRNTAQAAPADLVALMREIAASNGDCGRNVQLLTSAQIDVAVALGILRPAVLLPAKWIPPTPLPHREGPGEDLSRADLRTVLAHEAAHIQNHDLHWLAVSRVLLIVLWAQPLFWFVRRRMRLDQEALADAAAAELTSRQRYAEQLVAWAREMADRPSLRLSSAVGLWEGPSQLRRRVALLLDERFTMLRQCPRRWQVTIVTLCATAALGLSFVTLEPAQSEPVEAVAATEAEPTIRKQDASPKAAAKEFPAVAQPIPKMVPNTIAGRALDANGQPIAGAEVFLFRVNIQSSTHKERARTTTGADGQFKFENVIDIANEFPDGKIPLVDELGGEFLQVIIRAPGRVTESWLDSPQRVAKEGRFNLPKLLPAETLRGRVTGPDGKPVAGALVSVGASSIEHWEGAKSDRTDANGNYVIDDVAPFDMKSYREAQEAQRQRMEQARSKGPQYYATFVMPPLLTVEHPDFAVKKTNYESIPGTKDVELEPAAVLVGLVVYKDTGKPAAGAVVQVATVQAPGQALDSAYSFHRASALADEQGQYAFRTLPAGRYNVWAQTEGWVNAGISDFDVQASKTSAAPDLTFTKGALVSIRLVDNKTGAAVVLPPNSNAQVGAQPISFRMRPGFNQAAAPNADGKFEIRTVPGENRIWVGGVVIGDKQWMGAEPVEVQAVDKQTTSVDVSVLSMADAQAANGVYSAVFQAVPKPPLKPREAVKALTKMLEQNPNDTNLLLSRAESWQRLGEYGKAVADYEKLIDLKPPGVRNVVAHNNLAYLLAAAPDDAIRNGKRAVQLAEKARQLQPAPTPEVLDTLAAAYAEAGDFEKAIDTQQKAIELAPNNNLFRQYLKLYEAKQPRREKRPAVKDGAANGESAAGKVIETELVGTVLGPDDKPMAGVTVDAWSWYRGNETKTDAEGRFRLKGFAPNSEAEIEFRKNGLEPRYFFNQRAGTADWTVRMDNRTFMEGLLTDSQDQTVPNAVIRAERGPFVNEQVTIDKVATEARTDKDGHYRLYLEPDTYAIKVRVPGRGAVSFERQQIAAGEQKVFNIRMQEGITFRAKVIDSQTGDPVEGFLLWSWLNRGVEGASNAEGLLEIPSMFPGTFKFNVSGVGVNRRRDSVAGNYARWWSQEAIQQHQRKDQPDEYGFQRNFDDLEFNVAADAEPVTIYVEPCVTITGRVIDPDGKPVAGATVAPAKTGSGNSLTGDTRFSYETKVDGTFEMKLPSSGTMSYNLIAHDGRYLQWRNWANAVGEPFNTLPGDRIKDVELRLTRPATIRGQVTELNSPVAGKEVRAADFDNRANRYYVPTTKTDAKGRFELKFVGPGKQYIQVEPFWLDPSQAPTGTTTVVEVKEGETIDDVRIGT